jgi:glycosyltransferase involved in cell wall biosynthesis
LLSLYEPHEIVNLLRFWAFYVMIRFLRIAFALSSLATFALMTCSLPGSWIRNLLIFRRYRSSGSISFRYDFFDPKTVKQRSYRPHPSRILMIVPSLARGGAERMMIANAAELAKRGYQVRILALEKAAQQPDYLEEVKRLGLDYRCWQGTEMPFWAWLRRFSLQVLRPYAPNLESWHYDWAAEIAVQIQDYRPAVVHAWLNLPILIAGPICYLTGVPRFVGGQHDILDGVKRSWAIPHAAAYRMVGDLPNTELINVCAAGAREYERWLNLRAHSVKVIPNMFWRESVRVPTLQEAADYRQALGIPPGVKVVSTVTRFIDAKDPLLSVETAAHVAKMRSDVWFVFAGYGELAGAIADRIHELGLTDRIILPGAVSDVGLIYAITDVFLLTSRAEAAPIVLLEAQSAGTAIVTTDVGGIREIVQDGITARVVGSRSAGEFADAILNILNDPDWRSGAELAGPIFVAQQFAPDPVMDSTLALYGLGGAVISEHHERKPIASMPGRALNAMRNAKKQPLLSKICERAGAIFAVSRKVASPTNNWHRIYTDFRNGMRRYPGESFAVFIASSLVDKAVELKAPKLSYYADPFICQSQGRAFIFCEEFRYLHNKARLRCVALNVDLQPVGSYVIDIGEGHVSFPYLIEDAGAIYMIPETREHGGIHIYRCDRFPDRWVRLQTLIPDLDAVDTVAFKYEECWWLITSIVIAGNPDRRYLAIFYADDLLTGDWQSHPINEQKLYSALPYGSGRNAGAVIRSGSRLLRPAQHNLKYYGEAIDWLEITKLTKTEYAEGPLTDANPLAQISAQLSVHHITRHGNLVAWDVRDRVWFQEINPKMLRMKSESHGQDLANLMSSL